MTRVEMEDQMLKDLDGCELNEDGIAVPAVYTDELLDDLDDRLQKVVQNFTAGYRHSLSLAEERHELDQMQIEGSDFRAAASERMLDAEKDKVRRLDAQVEEYRVLLATEKAQVETLAGQIREYRVLLATMKDELSSACDELDEAQAANRALVENCPKPGFFSNLLDVAIWLGIIFVIASSVAKITFWVR